MGACNKASSRFQPAFPKQLLHCADAVPVAMQQNEVPSRDAVASQAREVGPKVEARKRDAIAAQHAGSMDNVHIPSIPKDEATIRFFGAQQVTNSQKSFLCLCIMAFLRACIQVNRQAKSSEGKL